MSFSDLNDNEKEVFLANRQLIDNLIRGKRLPNTDEEKHFLEVVKRPTMANTTLEIAYLKYKMEHIAETKTQNDEMLQDEEMIPNEKWGTRGEWILMRERWKENR